MTTQRLAEIRKEAYNVAYNYDGTVNLPEGLENFLDVYDAKKAIQEFMETPSQWIPAHNPVKKTKELALDDAIQLSGGLSTRITFGDDTKQPSPFVAFAKEIYQWLTEPETDKR